MKKTEQVTNKKMLRILLSTLAAVLLVGVLFAGSAAAATELIKYGETTLTTSDILTNPNSPFNGDNAEFDVSTNTLTLNEGATVELEYPLIVAATEDMKFTIDLNGGILKPDEGVDTKCIYAGYVNEGERVLGCLTIKDNKYGNKNFRQYFDVDDDTGMWKLTSTPTENYVDGGIITGFKPAIIAGGVAGSRLTIEGGNIVGNGGSGMVVGGIVVYGDDDAGDVILNLKGGKIIGNFSSEGGGVKLPPRSGPATIKISGNVTITDNYQKFTDPEAEKFLNNLRIYNFDGGSADCLVLTGNLTGKIGIYQVGEDKPAVDDIFGVADHEYSGAGNFVADQYDGEPLYGSISSDGKLVWTTDVPTKTWTVTFDTNGHGDDSWTVDVADGEKVDRPENPTDSGFTFGGWYNEGTCDTIFDFNTVIEKNTTLYAKWTPKKAPSKSSSHQGTSIWLTATPTPTPVPTETPAAVETPAMPTVKPTVIPTETPKSPVPFAGILAGLGAAAALFAVRRK